MLLMLMKTLPFDVNTLTGDEVLAESEVAIKDVNLSVDEVTLAQALVALKSVKPKVKANVVRRRPQCPSYACQYKAKVDVDYTFVSKINKLNKTRISPQLNKKPTLFKDSKSKEENTLQLKEQREEEPTNNPANKEKSCKMFDRAFKRVNTFVDFRTDLVEDEEEVAIDVVPVATKPPTIVEEDLKDLYKLVKAKYKSTRPVEDLDLVLWSDLKTMFEPHVEDEIWKLQQRYQVLSWKLFDLCGVHCLSLQSGMIYMLGRIVGIKSLLNAVSITTALIDVNAAQSKLVLLENFNENYSKCLRLLYKVNAAEGVNVASEEVSTAELVSTAYLKDTLFGPVGVLIEGVVEDTWPDIRILL
ncbi:hypothetical protein Tco_0967622 [Tanacetum coccineum]